MAQSQPAWPRTCTQRARTLTSSPTPVCVCRARSHIEDMDLFSINYMHWGQSKQWYGIPARAATLVEMVAAQSLGELHTECEHFLRHKTTLISPEVLVANGVPICTLRQAEGEFVITFPRCYHFGFNFGVNCAESTNFALPSWLPIGKTATQCMCKHGLGQAKIDMARFEPGYVFGEPGSSERNGGVRSMAAAVNSGAPKAAGNHGATKGGNGLAASRQPSGAQSSGAHSAGPAAAASSSSGEASNGKRKMLGAQCGTPGCLQPDFHDGPCTLEQVLTPRRRAGGGLCEQPAKGGKRAARLAGGAEAEEVDDARVMKRGRPVEAEGGEGEGEGEEEEGEEEEEVQSPTKRGGRLEISHAMMNRLPPMPYIPFPDAARRQPARTFSGRVLGAGGVELHEGRGAGRGAVEAETSATGSGAPSEAGDARPSKKAKAAYNGKPTLVDPMSAALRAAMAVTTAAAAASSAKANGSAAAAEAAGADDSRKRKQPAVAVETTPTREPNGGGGGGSVPEAIGASGGSFIDEIASIKRAKAQAKASPNTPPPAPPVGAGGAAGGDNRWATTRVQPMPAHHRVHPVLEAGSHQAEQARQAVARRQEEEKAKTAAKAESGGASGEPQPHSSKSKKEGKSKRFYDYEVDPFAAATMDPIYKDPHKRHAPKEDKQAASPAGRKVRATAQSSGWALAAARGADDADEQAMIRAAIKASVADERERRKAARSSDKKG